MTGAARVTVVTVLHDSARVLAGLLRSIDRQLPGAQVIAVDTDSRDAGPELAAAHGAEVVVLGANPGFGAANNAGVVRARAPVTILINPDCVLTDTGLTRLVAAAARHDALWVPRLRGADGRVQRSAHPLPGSVGALAPALVHPPLLPRALRLRAEPWRAERARTVGWAIAACMVARTATLAALGPFDPDQFLFHEDMDLCLRARAAGVPTLLDPSVAIEHLGGHSTAAAYAGEPHELIARRRRAVVAANRGRSARRLDDLAQALTFSTRILARGALRRPMARELAQLDALGRAIAAPRRESSTAAERPGRAAPPARSGGVREERDL